MSKLIDILKYEDAAVAVTPDYTVSVQDLGPGDGYVLYVGVGGMPAHSITHYPTMEALLDEFARGEVLGSPVDDFDWQVTTDE